MSIASKSQTIYTGCADIRAAIKEEDSTKGGGLITTLGNQIRALFARRFVVLRRKTDITEDDGEGNQVVTGTTFTQEKINFTGITTIPDGRFRNDTSLVLVILPETIVNIGGPNGGPYCFQGCTNLESINLENIQYLGWYCFQGTSLRSVNLKSLAATERAAFANCTKLREVKISGPITSLQNYSNNVDEGMFCNCTDLKEVSLGNVTSVSRSTFRNCHSLETVTGIENLRYIGSNAFQDCYKLGGFTLTEARTIDGQYTFSNVQGPDFYLGNNVTSIGRQVFYPGGDHYPYESEMVSLSGVVNLPNLTSIGGASFVNTKITEIQNLGTVTSLPSVQISPAMMGPFAFCRYLETVHLPSTLTSMGARAFSDCYSLTTVVVDGTQTFEVGDNAFYSCSSLTFEGFPWSRISHLGQHAFNRCTGISCEVMDLSSVVSVGWNWAFQNCPGVVGDIKLDSLISIGGNGSRYAQNQNFRSLSLMSIVEMGNECFAGNTLQKLVLGPSIQSVGTRTFQSCSQLMTVVIYAETPPTISAYTFYANVLPGGPASRKYYVPYSSNHSILGAYQTATNWSSFASQIYELNPDGTIPV